MVVPGPPTLRLGVRAVRSHPPGALLDDVHALEHRDAPAGGLHVVEAQVAVQQPRRVTHLRRAPFAELQELPGALAQCSGY